MTHEKKEKKLVFIVDDDKFLLDMYVLKFKEKGYDVAGFSSSEEGISRLEDNTYAPSIILLDVVMPPPDGFEFMERLKKTASAKIQVVVLSNLGEPKDIERAKELNAAGYIIKANFTPSEVVARVEELLQE
jgi:DNA-binding response OmpR family regulator